MSEVFSLTSGTVAVGDPTLELVQVSLTVPPGAYRLAAGALQRPGRSSRGPVVDTESMVVYIMDATIETRFELAFHELAASLSYNMATVQGRHAELEKTLGTRIGFYWVGDLSGSWTESKFVFNPKKVVPVAP